KESDRSSPFSPASRKRSDPSPDVPVRAVFRPGKVRGEGIVTTPAAEARTRPPARRRWTLAGPASRHHRAALRPAHGLGGPGTGRFRQGRGGSGDRSVGGGWVCPAPFFFLRTRRFPGGGVFLLILQRYFAVCSQLVAEVVRLRSDPG